jgi:hypothetical protein
MWNGSENSALLVWQNRNGWTACGERQLAEWSLVGVDHWVKTLHAQGEGVETLERKHAGDEE